MSKERAREKENFPRCLEGKGSVTQHSCVFLLLSPLLLLPCYYCSETTAFWETKLGVSWVLIRECTFAGTEGLISMSSPHDAQLMPHLSHRSHHGLVLLCGQRSPGSLEDHFLTASYAECQRLACFDDGFYPKETTQELKGQGSQLSFWEMSKQLPGGLQNQGIPVICQIHKHSHTDRRKCHLGLCLRSL